MNNWIQKKKKNHKIQEPFSTWFPLAAADEVEEEVETLVSDNSKSEKKRRHRRVKIKEKGWEEEQRKAVEW